VPKFISPIEIPASAGVGKVLTSNASGVAAWAEPTGGAYPVEVSIFALECGNAATVGPYAYSIEGGTA